MDQYNLKLKNFMFPEIKDIKNPFFLEFGVKEGRSTKMFLELCKINNGNLISVDVDDYSSLFDSPFWKFVHSRDDNFDKIEQNINRQLDVIYLDSLHEAQHVEKIFYHYFKFIKKNGYFFIDDISWLPYLKNEQRDNFYCEINNKETFEKLLEIYSYNKDNLEMSFSFISSGMCKIIKKSENLNISYQLKSRERTLKNILRKILKKSK